MDINVEYKDGRGNFPRFFEKTAAKNIALICDINTVSYAKELMDRLKGRCNVAFCGFPDTELVPDEAAAQAVTECAKSKDYLLAVGSGTLNDLAKAVSFNLGIECGVLATAPSMDGYCSLGAALMQNGVKVTYTCHSPSDVLIDLDIMKSAPKIMIAAGFGDILGKYTCLADWKLSNAINGEPINTDAYDMMEKARTDCVALYDGLRKYEPDAIAKLTEALIAAGKSMALSGNSRPASGSEHHMSHFLEMDFIRRKEHVPLHGLKVAVGTLISIELYRYVAEHYGGTDYGKIVKKLADTLPETNKVRAMLIGMGAPVRMKDLGVRRTVMEAMIELAYTVRDRYTILTLINDKGLTGEIKPVIMKKYF